MSTTRSIHVAALAGCVALACADTPADPVAADSTETGAIEGSTGAVSPTTTAAADDGSSGAAPGDSSGSDPPGPDDSTGADVDAGPPAYVASCAVCHGDDAAGTDDGPEIRHANPTLLQWFVRHGDTNHFADQTMDPTELQDYIGDLRLMTSFGPETVSDAELDEITAWLAAFPRASDGAGLFADHCGYCHGPDVPNRAFNPDDPDQRGRYYVKPGVTMLERDWAGFVAFVRDGVNPDLSPDFRRRYMPGFDPTLLDDGELVSIASWICGQYPDDVQIPADAFCNQIPSRLSP